MRIEVIKDEARKKEILGCRQSYGFFKHDDTSGKYLYTCTKNPTGMVPEEIDIEVAYALDEGPLTGAWT